MRYLVINPPPKSPSRVVSRDGVIVSTTPVLKGLVGKEIYCLMEYCQRRNLEWKHD